MAVNFLIDLPLKQVTVYFKTIDFAMVVGVGEGVGVGEEVDDAVGVGVGVGVGDAVGVGVTTGATGTTGIGVPISFTWTVGDEKVNPLADR